MLDVALDDGDDGDQQDIDDESDGRRRRPVDRQHDDRASGGSDAERAPQLGKAPNANQPEPRGEEADGGGRPEQRRDDAAVVRRQHPRVRVSEAVQEHGDSD
jgi:hypothetical protein